MGTIEMTRDEVQRYKDAIFRDEIVERSPSPWVSREAYYTCCNILRERNRSGDPDKVTVQFRHGDREGYLYTLHYTVTP